LKKKYWTGEDTGKYIFMTISGVLEAKCNDKGRIQHLRSGYIKIADIIDTVYDAEFIAQEYRKTVCYEIA
jgi:hypothetical protein